MPTVLVFVRKGFRGDFSKLEYQLLQLLDGLRVSIKLEILIGSITAAWNIHEKAITYWEAPPEYPTNGCSIGVRGDTEKAGTLGGWLMWNRSGYPAVKVGLTCYHLLAGSADKQPDIVYPAAMDLHHSIKKLKEKSAQPGCPPEDLDTLKKLQLMIKNAPIGRVVATSDNRLNAAGKRMDWALIQVVGNKTRNRPPSPADLRSTAVFTKRGRVYYEVTQDSLIHQFGDMEQNAWVVKNGRTAVVTAGEVNHMTRIVLWSDENIQSDEVEVFGLSTDFVHYGDSGSFVVDCHGALVGLFIGMDSSSSAFEAGFVTPIAAIQADVKSRTNGFLNIDL